MFFRISFFFFFDISKHSHQLQLFRRRLQHHFAVTLQNCSVDRENFQQLSIGIEDHN